MEKTTRELNEENFKRWAQEEIDKKNTTHIYAVVCDYWTEYERGWGTRPDGCSLHLTEEDHKAYIKDCWAEEKKRNPSGETPDEYDVPDQSPFIALVDRETYEEIKDSKNGVRKWQSYKVVKATNDDLVRIANKSQ
jgi:hypothetical protein